MNDITFKVAKKGEGKTRWLLEIANKYRDSEHKVFYCTDLDSDYGNFCEKYFKVFQKVGKIDKLSLTQLTGHEVVLIDDLMLMNFTIRDIAYIQRNCYKLYITLTGETEEFEDTDLYQLNIFEVNT